MRHAGRLTQPAPRELRRRVPDGEPDGAARDRERLGLVDLEMPTGDEVVGRDHDSRNTPANTSPPLPAASPAAERGTRRRPRRAPPRCGGAGCRGTRTGPTYAVTSRSSGRSSPCVARSVRRPHASNATGPRPLSASRSRSRGLSGSTRTSATAVMKFVSPFQRGQHVHVQMAGNARARGAAEVGAEVHAVGRRTRRGSRAARALGRAATATARRRSRSSKLAA